MALSNEGLEEFFSQHQKERIELDVLIVGAGLFGSVIGEALQQAGRGVNYIDAMHPLAGSRPAACLMKPSWLAGMGKENYSLALKTLDELFGVIETEFYTDPLGRKVTVPWVPPHRILKYDSAIKGTVKRINVLEDETCSVIASIEGNEHEIYPKLLIVAAGYWTNKLFSIPELKGLAGAAFAWKGSTPRNQINVWAPYKQVVTLNNWRKGYLWVGDGSAILKKNWTDARVSASLQRCAEYVKRSAREATVIQGVRPSAKNNDVCFLERAYPNTWIATGGAKNGTAAAGWAAAQIRDAEC